MKKLTFLFCLLTFISVGKLMSQNEIELVDSDKILSEAIKLTDLGKFDAAIEKFKKVPENDTNYELVSYEYGNCLYADKRYDQAIAIGREGIKKENAYTHLFYILLGNSLDDNNKTEEALKVYDAGIAKYPNLFLLHYNKAMALFSHERYDEAVVELKISLSMNSRHVRSHLLLGDINAKYGRTVQAMLCLNMAVMLQNDAASAKDCIGRLELIVNNKFERVSGSLKPVADESEGFEDVLTVLESGVAMNEKFKSKSKLEFDMIKQGQVLFETIKYNPSSKDFYMETYVKFFAAMNSEGYFVPFSYYILSSYDIPKVKDYLAKNKATIDKFVNWAGGALAENVKFRNGKRCQYFDNMVVSAMGGFSDNAEKMPEGKWEFFFRNGNKSADGEFVSGKKSGTWTHYNHNGTVRMIENFKAGLYDGPQKEFYESGKLSVEYAMVNDQVNGTYTRYYQNGQKKEAGEFIQGKAVGQRIHYFVNGVIRTSLNFLGGEHDGYNKECYPSGKTKIEATYLEGEFNGDYREFYENGVLSEEYTYVNGKPKGPFKTYYYTGQIETEGTYDENSKRVGIEKSYHFNGQLSSIEQYSGGELEGESKYYDVDGVLYSTFVYKNKRVASMKYFNKAGEQISSVEVPKGKQVIIGYHPEGKIAGEGSYYDNCLQGKWKYYDRNGVLESEKEYKTGILDGEYKTYHPNGQIEEVYKMKQGKMDSYYRTYYINGKIEAEGWYVDDQRQGIWKSYYINGKLASIRYYLNDEPYGPQQSFNFNGSLDSKEQWEGFVYNGIIYYDSVGKVWASCMLSQGSGHFELKTIDGKIIETADFVNGDRVDSLYGCYYGNLKRRFSGFYINDRREGLFTWYHSNGQKSSDATYLNGREEGVENHYSIAGKKSTTDNYVYGKDNGVYVRYYPNGKVRLESKYVNGEREGIRKYFTCEGTEIFRMMYSDDAPLYVTYLDQNGKESPPTYFGLDSVFVTTKYPSGQKSAEFSLKSGHYHGPYAEYFPNGKLQVEATYYYGNYNGLYRYYYPNGKVMMEENFLYGVANGPRLNFFENGKVQSEENVENGQLNGFARYYNESGKLIRLAKFYYSELMYEYNY